MLTQGLLESAGEPDKYLTDLEKFCDEHELEDEAKWYREAREKLKSTATK